MAKQRPNPAQKVVQHDAGIRATLDRGESWTHASGRSMSLLWPASPRATDPNSSTRPAPARTSSSAARRAAARSGAAMSREYPRAGRGRRGASADGNYWFESGPLAVSRVLAACRSARRHAAFHARQSSQRHSLTL